MKEKKWITGFEKKTKKKCEKRFAASIWHVFLNFSAFSIFESRFDGLFLEVIYRTLNDILDKNT